MIDFLRGVALAGLALFAAVWVYCSARCALWVKDALESYLASRSYARLFTVLAAEAVAFLVVTFAYLRIAR